MKTVSEPGKRIAEMSDLMAVQSSSITNKWRSKKINFMRNITKYHLYIPHFIFNMDSPNCS